MIKKSIETDLQVAMLKTIALAGENMKKLIDEIFDIPISEDPFYEEQSSITDSDGESSNESSSRDELSENKSEKKDNNESNESNSEDNVNDDEETNFQELPLMSGQGGSEASENENYTKNGNGSFGIDSESEDDCESFGLDENETELNDLEYLLSEVVSCRDTLEELCKKNKSLVESLMVNKDILGVVKMTLNGLKQKSGTTPIHSGGSISYGDKEIIWSQAPIYDDTLFLERYAKKRLLCDSSEPYGKGRIHFVVDISDSMYSRVSDSILIRRFDFQKIICFAFGGEDNRFHPFDFYSHPSTNEDGFYEMDVGRGTLSSAFLRKLRDVNEEWKEKDTLVIITDGEFRMDYFEKCELDMYCKGKDPIIILIGEEAKLKFSKEIKKRQFKMTTTESILNLNSFLRSINR